MGRFARRLCASLSAVPGQATSILSPANLRGGAGDRSSRVAALGCGWSSTKGQDEITPSPNACIPDLSLLYHLLAAEGLLFPSPSFRCDIAKQGSRSLAPSKGSAASAGFYLRGFRFGQDSSPPPNVPFASSLVTFTYSVLSEINSHVIKIINRN